ncbi:MAG: histidinol dehydrogenase [Thermodesulfobacteriota bacterium]
MKIHIYPSAAAEAALARIQKRGVEFSTKDLARVSKILADVRKNGDEAVLRYTREFDAPDFSGSSLRVPAKAIAEAPDKLPADVRETIVRAAGNVRSFHEKAVPRSWITTDRPGTILGQLVGPVDAAGVYVPGGRRGDTPLVSSVLMGVIPAKIAGVPRVAVTTPPRPDGSVHPYLLAAARIAGADEVYAVGSAWAVAALAYGTKDIPPVDVIVGPGNIFVTIAKKLVSGTVGIDMIAGPSEVLVVADKKADPALAAADLLSQAEHDPLARCLLVTDSRTLAARVKKELAALVEQTPRRAIAEKSVKRFAEAFVVQDLDTAAELANRIAAEHLELMVQDPFSLFPKIRHAGAMFLGANTPEPVGDYLAGPNHVLPTAGTARFSSALSVENFVKRTSLLHYSTEALIEDAAHVIRLAEMEGLFAHAGCVRKRT